MVPSSRSNRAWRPFGYWCLTINVSLGPVLMVTLPILQPDASLLLLGQVYPMLLAAWIGAAAIRQWGKNVGTES